MTLTKLQIEGTPVSYFSNENKGAPCIILIHPAFGDHTCFNAQREALDTYHLLLPDLLGHGASAGRGAMAAMTEYLVKMMDQEAVEKAVFVGLSMGGVIAQDVANKYGDRIAGLACFSSFDINHFDSRRFASPDSLMGKIMGIMMAPKKKFAKDYMKAMAFTPQAQEQFYELNMAYEKKYAAAFVSLGKILNAQEAPERQYPFIIGIGEHDSADIREANREWHEVEPDSRFLEFEGAGHLVNMDTPEAFNEAVKEIMEDAKQ